VFWLTRPPYLRWAAAAMLVLVALAWDLHGRAGVTYPFAATAIEAGAVIGKDDVEWRTAPRGLLPAPDLSAPVAARAIAAGDPILPSSLDEDAGVPEGWWAVPVALPAAATLGAAVRLIAPGGIESDGIVVAVGSSDLLSLSEAGLVAVPPESASAMASAAIEGTLIVLIAP
jgi:SAF domain